MRGTLPLKVRIPGCLPIRKASGTHDKTMRRKLIRMVHTLHEQGRDDLVNALARGTLKPLEVYNRFRFNRLADLPHADELPRFRDTWRTWLENLDCSDDHRHNTRLYFQRFEARMPEGATIGAVVDMLRGYREEMHAHPVAFNLAKSNVQSFLKAMLGRRHAYYLDVSDIPALRVTSRRKKHPLTPDQLRDLVKRLGTPWGPMAWTMATTGMGWREYTGPWEREGEGLRIHGTKTGGRDRLIPLVSLLHPPGGTIYAFRWHLDQTTPRVTPYDLRRTFAGLMVEAGVPAPRRAMYMGHGPRSMTQVYEMHEMREYLTRDAERIRTVLGEPLQGPTFRVIRAGGTK